MKISQQRREDEFDRIMYNDLDHVMNTLTITIGPGAITLKDKNRWYMISMFAEEDGFYWEGGKGPFHEELTEGDESDRIIHGMLSIGLALLERM